MEIELPYGYVPRDYQLPLWEYLQSGGKRAVAIWHRRAGKDLSALNLLLTMAVQRTGLYWHLLPTYQQGRKIVWDGYTKDGRPFLDYIPPELIRTANNTEMKVELETGSTYQVVGCDDVDRLVGANPVGCIFSEYSLQDPDAWNYIRPILAENGGWAIFIYTPRGRNHGWDMYQMAEVNENWFCQRLTVDDTNAVDQAIIQEDRDSGMPEEMIKQEYYCSFDAALVGSYYGDLMEKAAEEGRIARFSYDPRFPVTTAWDLGVHDSMAASFVQCVDGRFRFIDYMEDNGKGFEFYAQQLKERGYVYDEHLAPWDIGHRELSGGGKSRQEVALNYGLRFRANPKIPISEGINAVRQILNRCEFDEIRCRRLINALKEYRKEWDSKKKIFRDRPEHDWTSHPATTIKEFAWGYREHRSGLLLPKSVADYDPFSQVGYTEDYDPYDNVYELGQ